MIFSVPVSGDKKSHGGEKDTRQLVSKSKGGTWYTVTGTLCSLRQGFSGGIRQKVNIKRLS
jgi:hypothetical protein